MPDVLSPPTTEPDTLAPRDRTQPPAASTPTARKPLLVIEPESGWAAVSPREVWRSRELLLSLAGRDVKLRYKQTALGVAWVILQPVLAAAVFAFVFGKVAKIPAPDDMPYFLFAFAGMLAWTAFSGTLSRATNSMVTNAHLVSKVYFPRIVLPLSTVFSTLIDLGVSLVMLAAFIALAWRAPGVGLFLAPLCLTILLLLAVGAGLWMTALAVSYRDVQYILPVLTQILLYASPVAYPVEQVPDGYESLYLLNPLAAPLEALRWSVFGVEQVRWGYLAYSAAVALALCVVGAFTFARMERKFADVI